MGITRKDVSCSIQICGVITWQIDIQNGLQSGLKGVVIHVLSRLTRFIWWVILGWIVLCINLLTCQPIADPTLKCPLIANIKVTKLNFKFNPFSARLLVQPIYDPLSSLNYFGLWGVMFELHKLKHQPQPYMIYDKFKAEAWK